VFTQRVAGALLLQIFCGHSRPHVSNAPIGGDNFVNASNASLFDQHRASTVGRLFSRPSGAPFEEIALGRGSGPETGIFAIL